jgi:ATP-binding cassette, subfamily B, bacterial
VPFYFRIPFFTLNKNTSALLRVLGPYRWQYLLSTAVLMMSMFWRSLEPRVLQVLIDQVYRSLVIAKQPVPFANDFVSQTFRYLLPDLTTANLPLILLCLGLIYGSMSSLRAVFLFSSSVLKESATERAIKQLRDQAFVCIQKMPLAHLAKLPKGELVQRCTGDIDTLRQFLGQQVIAIIRLSSSVGFCVFMMALLNWQYALISVMLAPVIGGFGYAFYTQLQPVWKAHEAEADRLSTVVQENLNGIRVVTAFANQQLEIDRFTAQNQRRRAIGLRQIGLHSRYFALSDFLVNLQITISVLAGGYFAVSGRITVGELLGFFAYVNQMAWPMRELGKLLSQTGQALVAMHRITDILDAPQETTNGEHALRLQGDIVFENVSFGYPDGAGPVLTDVSFHIKPGQRVALIGPMGAGKSTLIKLLLRFYEADAGLIWLDGQPIDNYAKPFLRTHIGVAQQRAFLFSTTIRGNMAYTRPDSDEDTVEKAAEIAQAHRMKASFPAGFQTVVGERGVTLSGGQQQRVALARTVLSNPDILILDDTTSAVDTLTEQAIFDGLAQAGSYKTMIVVSSRLSTIEQADWVLVLDKGRIVQQGTPTELKQMPGYYQTIYDLQTKI